MHQQLYYAQGQCVDRTTARRIEYPIVLLLDNRESAKVGNDKNA